MPSIILSPIYFNKVCFKKINNSPILFNYSCEGNCSDIKNSTFSTDKYSFENSIQISFKNNSKNNIEKLYVKWEYNKPLMDKILKITYPKIKILRKLNTVEYNLDNEMMWMTMLSLNKNYVGTLSVDNEQKLVIPTDYVRLVFAFLTDGVNDWGKNKEYDFFGKIPSLIINLYYEDIEGNQYNKKMVLFVRTHSFLESLISSTFRYSLDYSFHIVPYDVYLKEKW